MLLMKSSQLWNASLGIYDPYSKKHEIVEFPGISHNPDFHMGAVQVDRKTGLVSVIADAAPAFPSEGKDISGTNWLLKYDPVAKEVIYKINLTETSQGKYGGFQDIEQDPEGNVFVVGTWPGTLLKVSKDGKKVTPWYLPENIVQTQKGIGGIAALDYLLLAQGYPTPNAIWRFDLKAEKGVPTTVKITNANYTFGQSDAIYLPPKYEGKVLLVAEDTIGISVFRSADAKWDTAEYKGLVPIGPVDPGTSVVTPAQVGDGIYQVLEPFGDEGIGGPGTAGNRTDFLFRDITAEIAALLK
ncbi:hypothetical protein BU24DRAFT_419062 [Aaosphaeria arxii CBS 175.79]|uniref:SMP-30/Gluconolactonase/LRE-like region domain-containing protein n=1 Tax=Aaosphaeria arxii CBS 175.79 TaxID=1450172 RepID=A0A6A5Y2G7_9PLEO|nr:uncharacterized protein BU24DRAFT_419062 [Aaosphaeria arxii CBS 175.79]KAF2019439.1 hypothetical protein BU24DRAFT_419062 [Aaosphaeria arxii CBS 175.79]